MKRKLMAAFVLVLLIILALVVPIQDAWRGILSFLPDDEPNTAASIAGWLQGLATVVALWFTYAALKVTAQEAHASNETLKAQQAAMIEQARPRAVVDFHRSAGDNAYYVIKNIGPGAAINVFEVDQPTNAAAAFSSLGGLLQGEESRLSNAWQARLGDQATNVGNRQPIYIVAESASGTEWTMSVNRMSNDNRIVHEVMPWKPSTAMLTSLKTLTIDERLRQVYARFAQNA